MKVGSTGRKSITVKRVSSVMRGNQGWSLVATLVMMVVIATFVAAMWSALLPAYLHVVNLRYKDTARAVNESTLDTVLAQINAPGSSISLPSYGSQAQKTHTTSTQGGTTFDVDYTILNCGSGGLGGLSSGGPPRNCILYSSHRAASDNLYLLTSNVKRGTLNRTLKIVLNPVSNTLPGSPNFNLWSLGGTASQGVVNEVGLACINGYNLPADWPSNNPYQFADTCVVAGVTWQIGSLGNTARSQVVAGSQFEYWQPGNQPALPRGTVACTYEPFTQIMGNVYSNYSDQNGANGNGYWMRNQTNDVSHGPNGDTSNANVFGAANGMSYNGTGVPSGYRSGSNPTSIAIPQYQGSAPSNGSGSTVNPSWGFNASSSSFTANFPSPGTSDGGAAYQSHPNTGGYIVAPQAAGQTGTAGALDTWNFPAPYSSQSTNGNGTLPQAPGAPVGAPQPATGGLGVPDPNGTYFSGSPKSLVVDGGTLNITNSATSVPSSVSVQSGQSLSIPPGNYNLSSLQVINGGTINIDPAVQGQTQFFMTPAGTGQGTAGAVYVDNTSSINMTGIGLKNGKPNNGFTNTGTKGFGNSLPSDQPAVDTAHPITETSGSCMNLQINTNASCNMLFAGNTRCLVNAPNANVNIGYQPNPNNQNDYTSNSHTDPRAVMANDANFYGAIISGNTSVVSDYSSGAGAYLHYDTKLKTWSNQGSGQPAQFNNKLFWNDPWAFAGNNNSPPPATQWRAESWQEALGSW